MTQSKAIAAAFASLVSFVGIAQASSHPLNVTMKPLHGVSFTIGAERAVSYFHSENGNCRLVMTLAEEPAWDAPSTFLSKRFEVKIPTGRSATYAAGGYVLDFTCGDAAKVIVMRSATEVATKGIN